MQKNAPEYCTIGAAVIWPELYGLENIPSIGTTRNCETEKSASDMKCGSSLSFEK